MFGEEKGTAYVILNAYIVIEKVTSYLPVSVNLIIKIS